MNSSQRPQQWQQPTASALAVAAQNGKMKFEMIVGSKVQKRISAFGKAKFASKLSVKNSEFPKHPARSFSKRWSAHFEFFVRELTVIYRTSSSSAAAAAKNVIIIDHNLQNAFEMTTADFYRRNYQQSHADKLANCKRNGSTCVCCERTMCERKK